jgi:site-specific recombinase XerD
MTTLLQINNKTQPGYEIVLAAWIDSLDSKLTKAAYRHAVELAFKTMGRTELGHVTPEDVAAFKASQQKKAASTIAQRLSALRSFFKYAIDAGYIEQDPSASVKIPKVYQGPPRALSLRQAKKIVEQVDTTKPTGKRDAAAIALLFGGLRVSEVVWLNVGDVALQEQDGHTFSRVHVVGKGNKPRDVDLPARIHELVAQYLEVRPGPRDDNSPLFGGTLTVTRKEPGRLTADWLYRQFRRYAKRAKVRISGSHAARHTWAKLAEQGGSKLMDIMAHLGHANLQVTATYIKRLIGKRNPASDVVPVLG